MFNKLINAVIGVKEKRKIIILSVIILVSALILLVIVDALLYSGAENRLSNWADDSKYQAVFLSNGQVYFGAVVQVNNQTLVLEDIYYLRVSRDLQASAESQGGGPISADNFSLIKLGNEIHGPEDRMSINLSHVLFVEDLKSDSKVIEAIRKYRE